MNPPYITESAADFVNSIDYIGTVAFAISGVLRGWQVRFNPVGVAFLAAATACGGGTIRDVLGGKPVPFFLQDSIYFFLVIGSVLAMYLGRRLVRWLERENIWTGFHRWKDGLSGGLEFFDAIGLAVFAIIGARFALTSLQHPNISPFISILDDNAAYQVQWYAVILFAILTGAGGGIIRDVVANRRPYAFSASLYAVFPALGATIFWLFLHLGGGPVTVVTVAIPTFLVGAMRLLYWKYFEFEREQYSSVVLLRDSAGNYLMEKGRSGYLSLIGGKWKEEDGPIHQVESLLKTAIREIREEIGLNISPHDLVRVPFSHKRDQCGNLVFRDRSIRTGEMVRYHMGVFDFTSKIDDETLVKINEYRDKPAPRRNRFFAVVAPEKIDLSESQKGPGIDSKEGVVTINGRDEPVSFSLLQRIRENKSKGARHLDGDEIFDGLGGPGQ